MSGLRFKVGEVAILRSRAEHPIVASNFPVGCELEVVRVGPFPAHTSPSGRTLPGSTRFTTEQTDYEVRNADGFHVFCDDCDLRKRPQPGIPESVLEVFRVPVRKGETV